MTRATRPLPRTHLRCTRLFVNAGLRFPLCQANAPLLDMDKTAWCTVGKPTCKRCLAIWRTRHPHGLLRQYYTEVEG